MCSCGRKPESSSSSTRFIASGRVVYLELGPTDVLELPGQVEDVNRLWTRGGFPDSVLAANDAASLDWRRVFVRSYLERDVPMFAPSALAVSSPTVARYLDLLVDLLLVRRLRPWTGNVGKTIGPKPEDIHS